MQDFVLESGLHPGPALILALAEWKRLKACQHVHWGSSSSVLLYLLNKEFATSGQYLRGIPDMASILMYMLDR